MLTTAMNSATFVGPGVLVLPSLPESVKLAREWTKDTLSSWPASVVDDAERIVSELVTNSIWHANSRDLLVQAHADKSPPIVEVWDWDTKPPVLREPDYLAETGRGLDIVDKLTRGGWGFSLSENAKFVWAVLVIDKG